MKHQPQLTLIGAGPGDQELITLKEQLHSERLMQCFTTPWSIPIY